MARVVTAAVVGVLAFLVESVGQQPAAVDGGAAVDRAMADASFLADWGQAELEAKRPMAALSAFQRAYALSSDASLLLEVGRLEEQVGSPARAAHAFEAFLLDENGERPPQLLQLARQKLRELGEQTARVNLQTNVQGAEVELEADRGVAKSSGFTVRLLLDAGERRINLSKAGYETQSVTIRLEAGEVRSLRVDLDKAARGRSQAAPARPRWAYFDHSPDSEGGRRLVEDERAAL